MRPLIALVMAAALAACAPRVRPLESGASPVAVPRAELPPWHQLIVFDWEYSDPSFAVRGEGAARLAPPDSGRVDLFMSGYSASAWLVGDTIVAPGGALGRRLLPPAPLMWAALGRLAIPPQRDTIARVDGDTLRAEIGHSPGWRVTFVQSRLVRLERIEGSRREEWVSREHNGVVNYRHETGRRSLRLTITRTRAMPPFDESVWSHRR